MEPILNTLVVGFQEKVIQLLNNCKTRGITMQPYFTVRDPQTQAKLWRQSRTTIEINRKINELRNQDANLLADCIENAGRQYGQHVTNAIPGLSWHQWGEAVDAVWIVNNKGAWSTEKTVNGLNGYMVYADEAKKLELDAGFYWPKFKDSPHVQFRKAANPLAEMSLVQIDREMEVRFSVK